MTCSGANLYQWSINGQLIACASALSSNVRNQRITAIAMTKLNEWDPEAVVISGHSDGHLRVRFLVENYRYPRCCCYFIVPISRCVIYKPFVLGGYCCAFAQVASHIWLEETFAYFLVQLFYLLDSKRSNSRRTSQFFLMSFQGSIVYILSSPLCSLSFVRPPPYNAILDANPKMFYSFGVSNTSRFLNQLILKFTLILEQRSLL